MRERERERERERQRERQRETERDREVESMNIVICNRNLLNFKGCIKFWLE